MFAAEVEHDDLYAAKPIKQEERIKDIGTTNMVAGDMRYMVVSDSKTIHTCTQSEEYHWWDKEATLVTEEVSDSQEIGDFGHREMICGRANFHFAITSREKYKITVKHLPLLQVNLIQLFNFAQKTYTLYNQHLIITYRQPNKIMA